MTTPFASFLRFVFSVTLLINAVVDGFSISTTSADLRQPSNLHAAAAAASAVTDVDVKITQTLPTGADCQAYLTSYASCPSEIGPTWLSCCQLPEDFPVGTFYRNGGCRFEADDGTKVLHPFDADGMICAITFDPMTQRILFRNKFIETEGYVADKATGKMSKRGIFGTMRSGGVLGNIFRTDFKNVANTNVLHFDGKVYALWEGGKPYVLDGLSLQNINGPGAAGESDLDGLLSDRTMTAHPRFDPVRNVWVSFGVAFNSQTSQTQVDLYELDNQNFRSTRKGRLRFVNNAPGLLHDFILSKNYMIFNLNAATVNSMAGLKALLGWGTFAEFICLDEEATETKLALVPRSLFDEINDGSDLEIDIMNDRRVKIIPAPFHTNFHFSNCFEDDNGQIVFDTVQSFQRDLLSPPASGRGVPIIENFAIWNWLYPTSLTRYSLDPEKEMLTVGKPPKALASRPAEFPTVPRELSTRPHRYIYASGSHNEVPGGSPKTRGSGPQAGSIMKVNADNPDENEIYTFEPYEFIGEVVFVQKVDKDVTNPREEDAGYLLSFLVNGRDKTTDLVIFDVEGKGSLQKGPVSRITLPTFVPQGLHGSFASGVTFDF